jgi:TDG/mug DNA glycosylase family protein
LGRLVEFCFDDEDSTKISYKIEWENRKKRKSENSYNCDSGESPSLSLESATSITPTTCDMNSIEQWTESKVANGIVLDQRMGLKVAKKFDTGNFIGQVVDVYADNDGEFFSHIVYEDGDSEDFNEQELQKGLDVYCKIQQKQRKRKLSSTTKGVSNSTKANKSNHLLTPSKALVTKSNSGTVTSSFEPLYDKSIPIHTLILGTHPAKKSLREGKYFSNPCNAFFWIAGDCLGFRRDFGKKMDGGSMKLCSDLRYTESHVIPYEQQVNVLCQHGFALWDIVASCSRKGSLDSAIKSDKPNDIRAFVKQHPTIKTIVFANGKSGLDFFNRHFKKWWETGEIIFKSSSDENKVTKSDKPNAIKCICALSVSPAAATVTYKEKRDFWDEFIYSPGLKFHEENVPKRIVTPVPHRNQQQQQQQQHNTIRHACCRGTDDAAIAIISLQVGDSGNDVTKKTTTLDPTSSARSIPICHNIACPEPSDGIVCTQSIISPIKSTDSCKRELAWT